MKRALMNGISQIAITNIAPADSEMIFALFCLRSCRHGSTAIGTFNDPGKVALWPYYFFVANETSPFLAGVFKAVFGAEKGWKKNETNRETLEISRIRK